MQVDREQIQCEVETALLEDDARLRMLTPGQRLIMAAKEALEIAKDPSHSKRTSRNARPD